MQKATGARRGFGAAAWSLGFWALAACAPRVDGPAPVTSSETAERQPRSVTVQHGQTLSGIAHTYHVPLHAIAEANHLPPPYRIAAGRVLIIPNATPPGVLAVPAAIAALPPATVQDTSLPASKGEVLARPDRREAPLLDHPAQPERAPIADAPTPAPIALTPPPAAAVAPGDKSAPISPAPAAPLQPPVSNRPPPSAVHGGAVFLWPVHGRVLTSYGSGADGTHNDGVNIGAPRGAAVQAADAGVVAYTGNELRGYGNLILVKHANGWISAYAHCDQILVKRGEKVARGQVIARVGSTGHVSEPQLHFELRRGNHAVDPREYLAPLPTAATKDSRSG